MKFTENMLDYTVIDENGKHHDEFKKDNIEDLNLLIVYLYDEYCKMETKQEQWFNKYWELKQKLNKIKDTVEDIS